MIAVTLSDVTLESLPHFERAMRCLAEDIGDPFRIESEALHAALFGENPAGYGALAHSQSGELIGAALYSSLISTAFGATGTYVSDLWVAEPARGQNAGHALLAYVSERAGEMWGAKFIKLTVYRNNKLAQNFYQRLGFTSNGDDEIVLMISGDKFEKFRD